MGSLVAEIEDRLALLSDPNTKWVQHFPEIGQSCLVLDVVRTSEPSPSHVKRFQDISGDLRRLIDDVADDYVRASNAWAALADYPYLASDFNDSFAKSRQDVIDFLNVALDIAEDEGL